MASGSLGCASCLTLMWGSGCHGVTLSFPCAFGAPVVRVSGLHWLSHAFRRSAAFCFSLSSMCPLYSSVFMVSVGSVMHTHRHAVVMPQHTPNVSVFPQCRDSLGTITSQAAPPSSGRSPNAWLTVTAFTSNISNSQVTKETSHDGRYRLRKRGKMAGC